jgi:hypothetical protein
VSDQEGEKMSASMIEQHYNKLTTTMAAGRLS